MQLTRRSIGVAGLGLLLTPVSIAAPVRKDPTVAIAGGKLRGRARGEVAEFLGVPYGADTRAARFAAPKAAGGWTGLRDALAHGAACYQGTGGDMQSEDCLVL